jgi:uncharacterized protein YbjQ (UPF0145 family)
MGFFDRNDDRDQPAGGSDVPTPPPAPPAEPAVDDQVVPADRATRLGELRAAGMWTSDLSIDELLLLRRAGYEPAGMVVGSSIYHIGLQWVRARTSQELTVITQAMYHARELALTRMDEEASTLDADGVVGVRLKIGRYDWGADLAEFLAVGTAVRRNDQTAPSRNVLGKPFTCLGGAQELYKIRLAGLAPTGVVMGSCVYHVAHQSLGQAMRTVGRNTEMPNYTQGLYEARELAMERMQREATRLSARGVLDMTLDERSYWGSHVIEFFAIGTAVVDAAALADQPPLGMILQLGSEGS